MKTALAILSLIAAAIGAGLAAAYTGLPDVAATTPHWAITEWVLSTTMENAVRRQAKDVDPPGFLEDEARIRAGAVAYDEMCATCHGVPGAEPGVIAQGLNPQPPELAEVAEEWSPGELFWITQHGVRMTGMPAFGPTHDDDELWEVVALVRRLPHLSPTGYRALVGSDASGELGDSHAEGLEPEHRHGHSHAHHAEPQ